MKPKVILLFCLFFTIVNYSQNENDKIVYFDSLMESKTKENHFYCRIIKDYYIKKESYLFLQYYKSGVLQQEGMSGMRDANSSEGKVINYYENGNKKSVINYHRGLPFGKVEQWYSNGIKKLEAKNKIYNIYDFFENIDLGKKINLINHKYIIKNFWDENGVQKIFKGDGFYENYNENYNQNYTEKGELKNGLKEGVWEGIWEWNLEKKSKENKYNYNEIYKKGKLISGTSTDMRGNTYEYTEFGIRQEPKLKVTDLTNYIYKNINTTKFNEVVNISFMVEKDSKITELKVHTKLYKEILQELTRIISDYKGFTPNEHRGVKVRSKNHITLYLTK